MTGHAIPNHVVPVWHELPSSLGRWRIAKRAGATDSQRFCFTAEIHSTIAPSVHQSSASQCQKRTIFQKEDYRFLPRCGPCGQVVGHVVQVASV
jgi:hypothetical protein